MADVNKPTTFSNRCPKCGSTNLQTEPLYYYEWEDESDEAELALFCVSCGHYLGEMPNHLQGQAEFLRSKALSSLSSFNIE